jgi:uncharacterized small protein (DUF1192 family)
MDELIRVPPPRTASEYKAAIDELLGEVQRLNEQIRVDRVEFERLKAESRELKAQTREVLAGFGARP